jgi:hypothetical protein
MRGRLTVCHVEMCCDSWRGCAAMIRVCQRGCGWRLCVACRWLVGATHLDLVATTPQRAALALAQPLPAVAAAARR